MSGRMNPFGNHVVPGRNRVDHGNKAPERQYVPHTSNAFTASRSIFGSVNRVLQERNIADNVCKAPEPQRTFMSSANVHLLEQFVDFCRANKINLDNEPVEALNGFRYHQEKGVSDVTSFRKDLNMYFGDQLPSNVVEELCKLVQDSSHGKCSSCMLPTESLIINILKILSDAAKTVNDFKENYVVPPTIDPNVRDIHGSSAVKDLPTHCSQQFIMRSSQRPPQSTKCTRLENHESTGGRKNVNTSVSHKMSNHPQNSREASDLLHCFQTNKPMLVLDTPLVMHQGNRVLPELGSMPANAPVMNKKSKIEVAMSQGCNGMNALFGKSGNVKECVVQPKEVKAVIDISDDRPARPEVRVTTNRSEKVTVSGQRFPISDEEKGLYNVICGLAHSQWSCLKAVEFSLTSVTYSSLGESVEPGGKVDNFFMSVICRKFFEDVHPRQSKKHFFYPKIGGCLYTYNCPYDIRQVQKSFIGANSAYKIHKSDKLLFPVVIHKHWFVFIVDLDNKLFVFLDSYFDRTHSFQIEASTRLINAFKECWYQYTEGNVDLEEFTLFYPPVPKQKNVVDCCIFAIKFMELWDKNIDLRHFFDQSDIANIRVKLGVELFFSKWNCLHKSLVVNLYQQGLDPRVCN